jgi:hypothetical protein
MQVNVLCWRRLSGVLLPLIVAMGIGCASSGSIGPSPGALSQTNQLPTSPTQNIPAASVASTPKPITLVGPITGRYTLQKKFTMLPPPPRGHVSVHYSSASISPAGTTLAVGMDVSVVGAFNPDLTFSASSVKVLTTSSPTPKPTTTPKPTPTPSPTPKPTPTPATGPYHIATWAYDEYGAPGSAASSLQVATYATYAETGLGNSKALDDCKAHPGTCKSVFYFDPSKVYYSTKCPTIDSDVVSAASESWYVHQAGYSDSAHRVNGLHQQSCGGSMISIPVWATNDAVAGVQSWWRSELQNNADGFDVFLMDDTQAKVNDQYYFNSGGGCLPWPSTCYTTKEVPTDAAVIAGHASFVNSLNHRNGQPMEFAFNSMHFDGQSVSVTMPLFSASSRLAIGVCEGCAVSFGTLSTSNYVRLLNTMAATNKVAGTFVLLSTDSASSGSSLQILERSVTTGLVWLGYSEGHTVAWPDLEHSTTKLAIWPEDLIYPAAPVQTMSSGADDIQVASGVWRREFKTCYQAGKFFGRCAAIVNSTSGAVTVQASWLSQTYGHVITLSGGDVLSGGNANITSTKFTSGSTKVPAEGASLLAQ